MSARRSTVVAITGASSGIGRATAQLFGRRGWAVGLVARNAEGLELTRKDVHAAGGRALVALADVADSQALDNAASRIEAELGPIDVWINNAGVSVVAPFTEITEEEFRRVTDVTYMGTVNGVRTALRRMRPRDRGTIVNVASTIAYRGAPLMGPYSGAKYAVRGFTEAVRSELIHDRSGIHLTMVHPPSVNTPFFSHAEAHLKDAVPRPPPPVYQPEIIADAILFAATHRRREVMVGGQTAQMVFLNKVAPAFTDWAFGQIGYTVQRSTNPEAVRLRDPNLFDATDKVHDVRGPWPALEHSAQLWATKHRGALATAFGAAVLLAIAQPALRREAGPVRGSRRRSGASIRAR